MTVPMPIRCQTCKWFSGWEGKTNIPVCMAFPLGIPDYIVSGKNDHTDNIKGDDGYKFESKTTNSKNIIKEFSRLKGGAGSGHFGHKGIPGHQGGSLPRGVLSSESSVLAKITKNLVYSNKFVGGKAIFVNGQFLKTREGANSHTQIMARMVLDDPGKYNKELVERAQKLIDNYTEEDSRFEYMAWEYNKDALKLEVDFMGNLTVVGIEGEGITRGFKIIQRAILSGDIDIPKATRISLHFGRMFSIHQSVPYSEIDTISGIIPDGPINAVVKYKEVVLKGGPGSGFYGHKGRKGEVGGSLPKGVLASTSDLHSGEFEFYGYNYKDSVENFRNTYKDKFLFHTTSAKNLQSIQKTGLVSGKKSNYAGYVTPEVAYATTVDEALYFDDMRQANVGKDKGILLRVKFSDVNPVPYKWHTNEVRGSGASSDKIEIWADNRWIPINSYEDSVVFKGGPGSGFYGHKGRPGKEGGSAPRGTLSSEVHKYSNKFIIPTDGCIRITDCARGSGSFFITDNNVVLEIRGDDHSGAAEEIAQANNIKYGLGTGEITPRSLVMEHGFIRINMSPFEASFEVSRLDNSMLRKLQRLVDEGNIDIHTKYDILIENATNFDYIRTSVEEFLSSKYVVKTDKADVYALKELILKGGEGSGFHGHKGIPGHQGGSLPRGILSSASTVDYSDVPVITRLSQLSKSRGGSKGYWIMQDGTMIDARLGENGWHEDSMIDLAKKNPQYTPNTNRINYTTHAVDNMNAIRVQVTSKETTIETNDIDKQTLQRLQRLIDEGKISSAKEISWGGDVKLSPALASSYNAETTAYTISAMPPALMAAQDIHWVKGYGGWSLEFKEFRLKGGAGSGHFGHKGRPGLEGGSLPNSSSALRRSLTIHDSEYLEEVDSIPLSSNPTGDAYMILPDGRIIKSKRLGHDGMCYDFLEDNMYELAEGNEDLMKLWDSYGGMSRTKLLIQDYDFIRVDQARGETNFETKSMDVQTLRRLQRLVDDDKIKLSKYVEWDAILRSESNERGYEENHISIHTNYEELMSSKYVIITGRAASLKEFRFKGGEGSGFHGHKGIPGHQVVSGENMHLTEIPGDHGYRFTPMNNSKIGTLPTK